MYRGMLGLPATQDQARSRAAAGLTLVTHGDSITSSLHPTANPTTNWSAVLRSIIQTRQGVPVRLVQRGISGHSFNYAWPSGGNPNTLAQDAITNVDPLAGPRSILCVFAGTNGVYLGGNSPEVEAAAAGNYISARIAAGFLPSNMYILSMLPREQYSERLRAIFNASLAQVAGSKGVNIVALHNNFDIGWPGQQDDTVWFADGIHPTVLGHEQIAEEVYDAIYQEVWSPTMISSRRSASIAYWFDGQDTATHWQNTGGTVAAFANGDPVARWDDKSGNARNLLQATGSNQPTIATKGVNLRRSIAFASASSQFLAATSLSGMPTTNVTIGLAAPVPSGNAIFVDLSSDGTNSDLLAVRGQTETLQTEQPSGSAFPSNMVRPFSFVGSWSDRWTLVNGARQVGRGGNTSATAPVALRVGRGFNNGFQHNGNIGEIICFAASLYHVDLARIDRWLRSRWGIDDVSADTFALVDKFGVAVSTLTTSNTVTISGLSSGAAARVASPTSGAQVSVNGGTFGGAAMIQNGDTLAVRQTTGGAANTENLIEVQVGVTRLYWRLVTA